MREIKFRAWDNEYKYMNYKVLVGNVWDTDINYTAHAMWIEPKYVSYKKEAGWCHFDEHSNIELMQYTGLKDKNEVEIYEGDIVKFIPSGEYGKVATFGKSQNLGIEWENSKTAFFTPMFYLGCESELEIIGNIYENPELLEKGNEL